MATEVSGTLSLVSRDAPGGFAQAVASAILSETPGSPMRPLSTVAEMCAGIAAAYDAILPQLRPVDSTPTADRPADGARVQVRIPQRLVLWVVSVADLGGVARHVLDTTRVGVPAYRLIVLCPEGPLATALRAQGSAVVTAPISPADPLQRGIAALRKTIRSLQPAVVHSHLAYSDFIAAAAAVGSGARLVTTEHGIAGDDLVYHSTALRSRMMATAHHVRLRRFAALIAVSDATLKAVRAKWRPPSRLRTWVIPNGVDVPARSYEPEPGRLHVVSLARLAPEKGLTDLVEAFALVHAARPDATLTLAGEGPLRGALERQIVDLGLADSVTLPGYVDAAELLDSADVLAQLSVWENCSYSLLDARAAGLRAVATDVGGNPELSRPFTLASRNSQLRTLASPWRRSSTHRGLRSRRFSVIIPTMQRSRMLQNLIGQCVANPLIAEVIVINNSSRTLQARHPKLRVLNQEHNIYVNPAWNLGASVAREEWLAILNDDILLANDIIPHVARVFERTPYSLIGPDTSCIGVASTGRPIEHRFCLNRPVGYGVAMFIRHDSFRPIPETMKIWHGDDWLFDTQRIPPAKFLYGQIETKMSTTTSSPEFAGYMKTDGDAFQAEYAALRHKPNWRILRPYLTEMREMRDSVRAAVHRAPSSP